MQELQLYANVRPCLSLPGYKTKYVELCFDHEEITITQLLLTTLIGMPTDYFSDWLYSVDYTTLDWQR